MAGAVRELLGFVRLLLVALVASLTFGGCSAGEDDDQAPLRLTFAGASAQGTFSFLGEGIGEALRREYPGTSFTYQPGSIVGSVVQTVAGKFPFGLAGSAELATAMRGEPPFSRAFQRDEFLVVARIIDRMLAYLVLREDAAEQYGISSLADIASKHPPLRLAVGTRGNLSVHNQAEAFFAAHGIGMKDIRRWGGAIYYQDRNSSMDLLKDGRIDGVFSTGFYPDPRLLETIRATPIRFIDLGTDAVRQVAQQMHARTGIIPAGAYTSLTVDYPSTALGIYVLASANTPEKDVYKVTRAIYQQFDYLKSLHPLMRDYQRPMLANSKPFPLHPGAARFYGQIGLMP